MNLKIISELTLPIDRAESYTSRITLQLARERTMDLDLITSDLQQALDAIKKLKETEYDYSSSLQHAISRGIVVCSNKKFSIKLQIDVDSANPTINWEIAYYSQNGNYVVEHAKSLWEVVEKAFGKKNESDNEHGLIDAHATLLNSSMTKSIPAKAEVKKQGAPNPPRPDKDELPF